MTTPTTTAPEHILPVANTLGECILWHPQHNTLWWTDIQASRLHTYDWTSGALQTLEAPERITSFGFVAASNTLITAFASGIALYDPHQHSVRWLARPLDTAPGSGVRFNDGRVDRQGRFWTGTMGEANQTDPQGCLYSLQGASEPPRCHLRGIRISNGLCFSPDGTQLYFADSPTRTISAYDLIEPEGLAASQGLAAGQVVLGPRRTLAQTPEGAYPDGATVDADGCIWIALWGAGCVARYTPDGRLDRTLPVPVSQPSCVCFAGPNLDVLCVTSARQDLDDAKLHNEPHAGDVFLYRVGTKGLAACQGLPESEYRV